MISYVCQMCFGPFSIWTRPPQWPVALSPKERPPVRQTPGQGDGYTERHTKGPDPAWVWSSEYVPSIKQGSRRGQHSGRTFVISHTSRLGDASDHTALYAWQQLRQSLEGMGNIPVYRRESTASGRWVSCLRISPHSKGRVLNPSFLNSVLSLLSHSSSYCDSTGGFDWSH